MKNRHWFTLGLLLGLFLNLFGIALAQKLSRTTPIAGGPPGQGFLGDYDSGLVNLPNSAPAVLTASTILVTNIYCHNVTGTSLVTITNTAGTAYISAFSMVGSSTQQFINGGKGLQLIGIKWGANSGNVNCQISGYQ